MRPPWSNFGAVDYYVKLLLQADSQCELSTIKHFSLLFIGTVIYTYTHIPYYNLKYNCYKIQTFRINLEYCYSSIFPDNFKNLIFFYMKSGRKMNRSNPFPIPAVRGPKHVNVWKYVNMSENFQPVDWPQKYINRYQRDGQA